MASASLGVKAYSSLPSTGPSFPSSVSTTAVMFAPNTNVKLGNSIDGSSGHMPLSSDGAVRKSRSKPRKSRSKGNVVASAAKDVPAADRLQARGTRHQHDCAMSDY